MSKAFPLELGDELFERTKQAAAKLGLPMAGWIRLAIQDRLGDLEFDPRKVEPREDNNKSPASAETGDLLRKE